MRRHRRYGLLALGALLCAGCEPVLQTQPQAVTLHLSGPAESVGIGSTVAGEQVVECSALLTIQASGEGFATWVAARVSWADARRPRALVLSSSDLEVIFGTAVVEAGAEHAGQIYGAGTGTFQVEFVLTYETFVGEDPGPTREAAYTYTCRAP